MSSTVTFSVKSVIPNIYTMHITDLRDEDIEISVKVSGKDSNIHEIIDATNVHRSAAAVAAMIDLLFSSQLGPNTDDCV